MAAQGGRVGEEDMVAHPAVVADMRADVEGAIVANRGDAAPEGGAAMHGHLLADQVALADDQPAGIALLVAGVLRAGRTQHGEGIDLGSLADLQSSPSMTTFERKANAGGEVSRPA